MHDCVTVGFVNSVYHKLESRNSIDFLAIIIIIIINICIIMSVSVIHGFRCELAMHR